MLDANLGTIGVWLAFLACLAGIVVSVVGLVPRRPLAAEAAAPAEEGRPGTDARLLAPVMCIGALLAAGAMEHALVTHDFSLVFVAQNNSTVTPLLYSITGMWSALAGSILLWGLILAVVSTIFVWRYRRQAQDSVIRYATLVLYVVSAFFFGLMVGPANPFITAPGATQGLGPNSLLQDNPLVAIHPPLLYVGFVVFTVPFAFAIGMLATGRVGDRWQIECRRWTLVAFTFLSVGIVLGAWWSYQVLGWGGFWGWDPVENAALLPWLCGTAYLHSTLVQERRGLMRVWNLSLSIATFALTILGTFLTRSGVITSVHAFSESDLGPLLIGFFFAVVIVGFGLIAWRGDRLRSPGGIDAPLGREGAFLLNNVLFVGFAFVVLLGTLYPLLYEAATQQQVTVGAPFFNTVAIPVGLTLLFLMAVAPVLSWRKINGAILWQRLAIPVWIGVGTVVLCVAFGLRGTGTLVGFGLGAIWRRPRRPGRSSSPCGPPTPVMSACGVAWWGGPTGA
jgi:cytochrome c-type biogenesis protein CcmF